MKTLFDPPPLSRLTDPETSREAAEDLVESGTWTRQMKVVYLAMCMYPGRTAAELADLAGLDRYMVSRRCSNLRNAGAAYNEKDERGEPVKRVCDVKGTRAIVWWPVVKPEWLRDCEGCDE